MENNPEKLNSYLRSIQRERETLFRGVVWGDLQIIDQGLIGLRRKLGNNDEHVSIVLMGIIEELTTDYLWDPHGNPKIIPEA